MEKKLILAILGGTITMLIIGGILFAGLMGGSMEQWTQENASCLKEMSMIWWLVGSLIASVFMAILIHKFGRTTFLKGAIDGAWITFFMVLWYGVFNASTFTAYGWDWLPFDLLGNMVAGSVAGGVIAWILGKVK